MVADENTRRPRGRPRDPAKRAALLEAARRLFISQGPDAVTVDQIVAEARVARATFYLNFADKQDLFAAAIEEESRRVVADDWVDGLEHADLRDALTGFARGLLRLLSDVDSMRFEQRILQATQARPEVGTKYFDAGPGRARRLLETAIRAAQARGDLKPADTERAANDLLGLCQGCWRVEVMYGRRPTLDASEIDVIADHAVQSFLELYRSRPAG